MKPRGMLMNRLAVRQQLGMFINERIEKELQLPFPSRVDGKLDSLARSYARSSDCSPATTVSTA